MRFGVRVFPYGRFFALPNALTTAAFPDTSRLQLLALIRVVERRTVLAVLDAVEVSRLPNPNQS